MRAIAFANDCIIWIRRFRQNRNTVDTAQYSILCSIFVPTKTLTRAEKFWSPRWF